MGAKRAHIVLQEDVVKEIDKLAGSRGRSAFLTDLARREIKRRRLLEVFKEQEPIWKDEDHPELQGGSAEWIRQMRAESEVRFRGIEQQRDRD
jgi:hypothetical protein